MVLFELVLGLAVAAAAAPSPASDPAALVAQVRESYAAAPSMRASFRQTHTDRLRGRPREERGTLVARRDGRVRWSYTAPARKEFIFDGSTATFYEPENAQATVFADFADSPAAQASQFLWGQGDLARQFALSPCAADCPAVTADEVAIDARPRAPLPTVARAVLVVDARARRVVEAVLFDAVGNKTVYRFADIVFGVPAPASLFTFTPPPGVSLLRASAGGPGRNGAAPAP